MSRSTQTGRRRVVANRRPLFTCSRSSICSGIWCAGQRGEVANMKSIFRSAIAIVVVLLNYVAPPAQATPLYPENFTSLGQSPFTMDGTYTITAQPGGPVLTRPDSSTITGIVHIGEAVFTFDT